MYISEETAHRMIDAISHTIITITCNHMILNEMSMDELEQLRENIFMDYCAHVNIEGVEVEDDDDYPDDVDESNYDPYMGCDSYETDSY